MFPADDLFSRYAQNYEGRKEVEMTLFEYLEACKVDPLIYASAAEQILAASVKRMLWILRRKTRVWAVSS